jgi:glycerate 2-kinase
VKSKDSRTAPTIVVAPDSFKGTLSAQEATVALCKGLLQVLPHATIIQCPMADGGEGTLQAFQAALPDGSLQSHLVTGADGQQQTSQFFEWTLNERPAVVIEVANVVGITESAVIENQPCTQRTTLGVGELIQKALDQGVRSIYIGLGGSSTNDGGAGLLVALGAKLLDTEGHTIPEATPRGLSRLAQVDCSGLNPLLQETHLEILSDVDNPLCGPRGATQTFGLQKGLRRQSERDRIDRDLAYFATLAQQAMAQSSCIQNQPGAGAAGGLGFALQLLGAKYTSGAQCIAQLVGLGEALDQADWLITGEGCSDRQTLMGKVPQVVAGMAKQRVHKTLLSGAIEAGAIDELLQQTFQDCFTLSPSAVCLFKADAPTLDDCLHNTFDVMVRAGVQLGHYWQTLHPDA